MSNEVRIVCLTTKLTDRHELTYENQKPQGKSPGANGGSVQRFVSHHKHRPELPRASSRDKGADWVGHDTLIIPCSGIRVPE